MFESGWESRTRLERYQGNFKLKSRMQGLDDFLSDWEEAEGPSMAENKEKKKLEKTLTVRQGSHLAFSYFVSLMRPVYSCVELV